MEFLDYCPSGLFNSKVSVLRLFMFVFNGMRQSIATGNSKTFDNSASDISILAVCQ